jgi:S-formylglutathione hydrolase FrmB
VVGCVRKLFEGNTSDAPVFIAGLSMGGYGALRMGAKYADRFHGISVHSAVTKVDELNDFVREPVDLAGLTQEELDLLHWMRLNREKLPPIRLDCGTEDHLYPANCAFHAELDREQIQHQFFANSGNHCWPYWEKHVADTLLFFESILKSN